MDRKFGALWNKKKEDRDFMSGEMVINGKKISIVCFKRNKKQEKEPDWDILVSREENKMGLTL